MLRANSEIARNVFLVAAVKSEQNRTARWTGMIFVECVNDFPAICSVVNRATVHYDSLVYSKRVSEVEHRESCELKEGQE